MRTKKDIYSCHLGLWKRGLGHFQSSFALFDNLINQERTKIRVCGCFKPDLDQTNLHQQPGKPDMHKYTLNLQTLLCDLEWSQTKILTWGVAMFVSHLMTPSRKYQENARRQKYIQRQACRQFLLDPGVTIQYYQLGHIPVKLTPRRYLFLKNIGPYSSGQIIIV